MVYDGKLHLVSSYQQRGLKGRAAIIFLLQLAQQVSFDRVSQFRVLFRSGGAHFH